MNRFYVVKMLVGHRNMKILWSLTTFIRKQIQYHACGCCFIVKWPDTNMY